jgi:hypothetical protein
VDLYAGLSVGSRSEDLALGSRYSCIAGDKGRRYATQRLNTKGKRCDVQKQYVVYLALEDTRLYGGAYCYNFVRIDTLVRLFAK